MHTELDDDCPHLRRYVLDQVMTRDMILRSHAQKFQELYAWLRLVTLLRLQYQYAHFMNNLHSLTFCLSPYTPVGRAFCHLRLSTHGVRFGSPSSHNVSEWVL